MAKLQSILEVLKPIPPDDMRSILQGYLGSDASQADAKTHVRVWELLCLENKTPLEIAKIFKVTSRLAGRGVAAAQNTIEICCMMRCCAERLKKGVDKSGNNE